MSSAFVGAGGAVVAAISGSGDFLGSGAPVAMAALNHDGFIAINGSHVAVAVE